MNLVLESHGGTKAGFVVPDDVVERLGGGGRPKVSITLAGYTWRSSIARMGGRYLLGMSNEHRRAAGVDVGETFDVVLALDDAPREVDVPDDLAQALEAAGARTAWEALSFTARKEHVRRLTEAKRPETRARRLETVVTGLAT